MGKIKDERRFEQCKFLLHEIRYKAIFKVQEYLKKKQIKVHYVKYTIHNSRPHQAGCI